MARKRTGQLIERTSGWYARVWTTVDGERVRVMRALGTKNKVVARRKLEKLLAVDDASTEDVRRPETFREAAERVYGARIAEYYARRPDVPDSKGPRDELAQLRRYAYPILQSMPVTEIQSTDINAVLDHVKEQGKTRATAQHLRQRMSNVFGTLRREGVIKHNPVDGSDMPRFAAAVVRERAVLTDAELAVYLAWEDPEARFSNAIRERQTMSCVSRMFGGLRTGDLHALRWEAFDVEHGAFEWGYAPRQKTRRPQLLEVPAMLRPMLRDWWERAGRPRQGLLFPVRRIGKKGDRVGQQRLGVTHALAFRRDLQAAFKAAAARGIDAPRPGSQRWRELFTEADYTRPVDFHSWRRAYVQALGDADVNAQQASALAGHASLAAHALYLRNAGKLRKLPEAALPQLTIKTLPEPEQKALAKGRVVENDVDNPGHEGDSAPGFPEKIAIGQDHSLTYKANVAGSIPVPPTPHGTQSRAGASRRRLLYAPTCFERPSRRPPRPS